MKIPQHFTFTQRNLLKYTLLVILVCVSIFVGLSIGQTTGLEKYRKQYNHYQSTVVTPTLKLSDSLKTEIVRLQRIVSDEQDSSNKLTDSIQQKNFIIQQLRTRRTVIVDSVTVASLPPECDLCKRAVVALTDEVDSLYKQTSLLEKRDTSRLLQIDNLTTGLRLSTQRGDSLERVIINWPTPPRDFKIFGLELSRKQIFLIGTVSGAAVAMWVHNRQ